MWPFGPSRPRELSVTVRHEIVGLDLVADALRELAKAQRYAAKSSAGRVFAKRKNDEPEDPAWKRFVEENPRMAAEELLHMEWAYRILRGKDKADEEERADAIRLYSLWQRAGVGLPEIDGRPAPSGVDR